MKAVAGSRILMLTENNPYPQDPRVRAEATTLAAAGYRVTVVCPAAADQPRYELLDGVTVRRYPAPANGAGAWGYLWEYAYSLAAALVLSVDVWIREGFDVLHAHNPPDAFVFIAALYRVAGKRFVFDHHDLSPEMYDALFGSRARPVVHRVLALFEKLSCRLADHVIAANESYKQVEMSRGRVPESRITVVRNGPNLQRLRPVAPDPVLRARAGTIFAYAGTIGNQDGVDYLLRALHHLATTLRRSDWYCVVIGQGHARARLKALASELDLSDRVSFPGFVSDGELVRTLCTADICVDPDPSNPFNDRSTMIKMMEYMALGKPIVAFDLPEHRHTAAGAAVYVRGNDECAFAEALASLMDDPARREAMGAIGRTRVETELAWRRSAANLLQAYRGILPVQSSPSPAPASNPTGGIQ